MICPCCEFFTLHSKGEFEICEVCFWEDDPVQRMNPDYFGGANKVSLNQGKKNFIIFNACEEQHVNNVRNPLPDEYPQL